MAKEPIVVDFQSPGCADPTPRAARPFSAFLKGGHEEAAGVHQVPVAARVFDCLVSRSSGDSGISKLWPQLPKQGFEELHGKAVKVRTTFECFVTSMKNSQTSLLLGSWADSSSVCILCTGSFGCYVVRLEIGLWGILQYTHMGVSENRGP